MLDSMVPAMVLAEVPTTVERGVVGLLLNSLVSAARSSGIASREMPGAPSSICKGSVCLEVPSISTIR